MAKSQARVSSKAAIASFGKAHGLAVAEQFLKTVAEQASKLGLFLVNIVRMDAEGRQAFRLTLQGGLDTVRKNIKNKQAELDEAIKAGAPDEQVKAMRREIDAISKTFNSQKVRVSEATMFARAVDKMHAPDVDFVQKNYHRAIADARQFLRDAGAGSNRGRKAKPAQQVIIETVKKLWDAGAADAELIANTFKAVNAAIKKGEWEAPKGAEQPAEVQARKIGPTQRHERKTKADGAKGEGFVPVKTPTHQPAAAKH